MPAIGYEWHGPVPQASMGISQTYTAYTAGVYTLVVKDLNNGCTSFATKTLILTGNPQISSPTIFNVNCPNPTVSIFPMIVGSTSGLTYSWSVPPTASVSALTTQSITTNSPGIYTVVVTGSIASCFSTTLVNVAVCAGVNENLNASNNISIFPNPATDILNINFNLETEFTKVEIFNNLGQLIRKEEIIFKSKSTKINTKELSNGVYLLKLLDSARSDNSGTVSKRFVIAR